MHLEISQNHSTVYTYLSAGNKKGDKVLINFIECKCFQVAYNYRTRGLPSISEHISVSLFMKGIKREGMSKPIRQATPFTPEILAATRTVLTRKATLVQWRTVWRMHMEFALMLRFDDLRRLKVNPKIPRTWLSNQCNLPRWATCPSRPTQRALLFVSSYKVVRRWCMTSAAMMTGK